MAIAHLSRLVSIKEYLTILNRHNLVSPSIGRPYPILPINEEKTIIHNSLLEIQQLRCNALSKDIKELLNIHGKSILCNRIYREKVKNMKERLQKKILFLLAKFKPDKK